MVGSSVMFTPKGLSVIRRVSRTASRSASGLGWVSAVRIPVVRCELHESIPGLCGPTKSACIGNRCCERRYSDPVKRDLVVYLVTSFPGEYSPLHATLNNRPVFFICG